MNDSLAHDMTAFAEVHYQKAIPAIWRDEDVDTPAILAVKKILRGDEIPVVAVDSKVLRAALEDAIADRSDWVVLAISLREMLMDASAKTYLGPLARAVLHDAAKMIDR